MAKRFRVIFLLAVAAFVGVDMLEPPPVSAVRGWHYKHKKPPGKRPRPKKKRGLYVQTDPLRILKNFNDDSIKVGPNIIIAMDTSMRMQYDSDGHFYDERYWDATAKYDNKTETPPRTVATTLGVPAASRYYRRKLKNLVRTEVNATTDTFAAELITATPDSSADYLTFYDTSRLGMARDGLYQAIDENMYVVNFGLLETRHKDNVQIPEDPGNQYPVVLSDPSQANLIGDIKDQKQWKTTYMVPTARNVDQAYSEANVLHVKVIEQSDASSKTAYWMMHPVDDDQQDQTLVPAGRDTATFHDSPVKTLIDDALTAVKKGMEKDKDQLRPCRNTAVILVVGGKEGGSADPVAAAAAFQSVTVKGTTKPVPLYVIAVGVPDADLVQLQAIADAGGGELFDVWDATQISAAANYVAQSVFRRGYEFDADLESEFQTATPIVGSVDLTNATDIHGTALPNTSSGSFSQASNVVLTSGFSLPGFNARLRAFRTYKPVADATQPYGYKFSGDGTPLWLAHAPAADQRNIYTYLPSTGQQIAFTQANIATLKPYLGLSGLTDAEATAWAADIIDYVRQQPLGPIVLSTPALVGPPSMSPVPDADYPAFASARKQRRATVYYGGDDGMIHAIDGRLGVETWAFIPFNLLPQLQTLIDGQPIDSFEYFVSGAPKVADVKVNGAWRTYMMIGEALGGTFYQTFDISNANLGVATSSDSESAVLASFSSPDVIPFKWSFPSMLSFDPTMVATYMPYGDLKASASAIEKTVGQATSTPAIAQVGDATSPWVALVGSGYLSPLVQAQANRNKVNGGTTFYVLDMATGSVLSSYNVGDDANKESLKAALEADPSSMGTNNSWFIDRVYIGDTEGTLWRFRITKSGSAISLSTPVKMYDAAEWNPIYTSVALLNNGPEQNYIFLSTGIDILPWTRMKKVQQFAIIGLLDSGGTGTAQKLFEQKLDKSDSSGGDERPTSNPTVAGGVVFFTTTTEYPDTPCRTVESSLWAMTPAGGVAYDLNRDGHTTTADTQLQRATGRATGVYVADNHLYFGTDQGLHVFGEPDGFNNSIVRSTCRTLAWRERR